MGTSTGCTSQCCACIKPWASLVESEKFRSMHQLYQDKPADASQAKLWTSSFPPMPCTCALTWHMGKRIPGKASLCLARNMSIWRHPYPGTGALSLRGVTVMISLKIKHPDCRYIVREQNQQPHECTQDKRNYQAASKSNAGIVLLRCSSCEGCA